MQVSWKQSYSTRSSVQDVRLRHRSRLQRGRVTCKVLRTSNIQLTTGRDREIAGLILLLRYKLSSKGTSSRYFTAIRGRFVLGTARVKALGCLKKKERKKKRKMTKLDFHHFQVRHFNNVFDQSWCHCIFGATPASRSNCLQTRRIYHQVKYQRLLNANTCIEAAILFSGHPYIGRHYRAP